MLKADCDICHATFVVDDTGYIDGEYRTVRMGITNVRVRMDVRAFLSDQDRQAHICADCRRNAIETVISHGHSTLPGHQAGGDHLRRLRDERSRLER